MTVFQVVAECAHATVNDAVYGRTVQLLYKGALVSPDAPELKRLLELGFVEAPTRSEVSPKEH
jgi:hypothetical protein